MKETGGPAFPFVLGDCENKFIKYETGMTLRDYFAAKAMQGIQSRVNWSVSDVAATAYLQADAMLKERQK